VAPSAADAARNADWGAGVTEPHPPLPAGLWRRGGDGRGEEARHPYVVLATALFGLFTVGFTITILAVSLNRIAGDLDSSKTTLTWVITGPMLAFGIVGPAAGRAGDLWGHKRTYLLGVGAAGLFAIGIASAWDAPSLIAFRVLSAAAGAAAGPSSMALIYSVFPPEKRVQALGWWSTVMAGGPVVGVVAGGPLVEAFGWRWIFVVQVPLTLLGVVVAALLLPETPRAADRARFDLPGAVLLAAGVTSLLLALNRGPVLGWASPVVVGAFALCPFLLWAFVRREERVDHPLVRIDYFRRRNVVAPVITQFATNFAYMGGFILTPFLLSEVFGYGETRIGLLSIARPACFAIAGPLCALVARRFGERRSAMFGAAGLVASMVILASLGGSSSDLLVVLALGLSGIGMGISVPAMNATVANAVDPEDLGVASAASQLMSQIGTVAGIQIMQTVQVAREGADGLAGSYHVAYLVGAVVAGIGIVAAGFVRSGGNGPQPADGDVPRAAHAPEGDLALAGATR
jgi:EmrB/QacA subfamily drug resistance transporter